MAAEKKFQSKPPTGSEKDPAGDEDTHRPWTVARPPVKIVIRGEEMIEKRVKASGNSGRVYLPPDWIGHKVKIARID